VNLSRSRKTPADAGVPSQDPVQEKVGGTARLREPCPGCRFLRRRIVEGGSLVGWVKLHAASSTVNGRFNVKLNRVSDGSKMSFLPVA
jgi:hypothetical protein